MGMSDVERKAFLTATVAGLGGLLSEKLLGPRVLSLGTEPLAQTRATVDQLRYLDGRYGGARVLVPIIWTADRLARLLRETPQSSSLYRDVVALTVDAACLGGWVALDQDDGHEAFRLYSLAVRAGKEAGDADLAVLAGDGQARVLAQGFGRPDQALALLGQLPGNKASPTTRAFLEAQRARAFARAGKAAACHRALDRCATAIDAATFGEAPPGLVWFGEGYLELHRGYCLVDLGEGEKARKLLLAALRKQPKELYRGTGVIHQRLAEAAVHMGDPELAVKHAGMAHRILSATNSVRRADEVVVLGRALSKAWPDVPAVRELDEQFRADTRYVTTRSMNGRRKVHQRACPSLNRGQTSNAVSWREGIGMEPAEVVAFVGAYPAEARTRLELCQTCMPSG